MKNKGTRKACEEQNKQVCQVHPTTEGRKLCELIQRQVPISPKTNDMTGLNKKCFETTNNDRRCFKVLKSEGRDEREFSLRSLDTQKKKKGSQTRQKKAGKQEKQTSVEECQQEKKHLEEFGGCSA